MSITAILLAGGKSTRMGRDKVFIQWQGKPFLEHIIEAAKSVASKVVLSGDKERLDKFGLEVIEDKQTDNGPVFALASSFQELKNKTALVLSCDVPQIRQEDLELLLKQHTDEYDVTCFEFKGKVLPLVGVYNPSCFKAFEKAMLKGERRLFSVLEKLKVNVIKYERNSGLSNMNTPQDLKELI